jgi:hypothetical protein
MIGKILGVLWNTILFQDDLDKHYVTLSHADISKEVREQLITDLTRARIVKDKWQLGFFVLVIILLILSKFL